MSTRSTIAIKKENTIEIIYCHWDGYPDHNGRILETCYTEVDKIQELIDLGDLSVLAEKVKPEPNQVHTFDNPIKGITIAYSRDRGEDCPKRVYTQDFSETDEDFIDRVLKKESQDYNYIFMNDTWNVFS